MLLTIAFFPAIIGEIFFLYRLIGRDELTISGDRVRLRRRLFGIGLSRWFDRALTGRLMYMDAEGDAGRVSCLYFEHQFMPYYFAKGIDAEAANEILKAVTRFRIPGASANKIGTHAV